MSISSRLNLHQWKAALQSVLLGLKSVWGILLKKVPHTEPPRIPETFQLLESYDISYDATVGRNREKHTGLYRGSDGTPVVIKALRYHSKNAAYRQFMHEVHCLRALKTLSATGEPKEVRFPDLLSFQDTDRQLMMVEQKLPGIRLGDAGLDREQLFDVLKRLLMSLRQWGEGIPPAMQTVWPRRSARFLNWTFPFYWVKALMRSPKSWRRQLTFWRWFYGLRGRASDQLRLAHRELHPNNILIDSPQGLALVDFEVAAMAEPGTDVATTLRYYGQSLGEELTQRLVTETTTNEKERLNVTRLSLFYTMQFLAALRPGHRFFASAEWYARYIHQQLTGGRLSIRDRGQSEDSAIKRSKNRVINNTWATRLTVILAGIFCVGMIAVSLRGLPGNTDVQTLSSAEWQANGPFESSNDRGRYALMYSFLEEHSLQFSIPVAQFATPDLAKTEEGQFVSLFAPGVSFFIIPGYLIGKFLGASQVGAFAVVALFALLNTFLVYAIARKLGAHPIGAGMGALTFLFATPAYTYAVSISQHHFSVALLLFSLYLLISWSNWWSLSLIWFSCALSIAIDNPNFFLMFPIGLYALGRIMHVERKKLNIEFTFKPLYLLTFLGMTAPLVFFGWFNQASNGSPFKLSGTLERVLSVSHDELSLQSDPEKVATVLESDQSKMKDDNKEKTAVGFFKTRYLWNGFDVHFISADRGVLWFTPTVLLGVFGIALLFRLHSSVAAVIIASIGANVLLYSMWGDPWGGWAFGSRYLIPTYALLSIGLGIALSHWRKNLIFLTLFLVLFTYSVRINTLGALGTSAIPPQAEVLALEKVTGKAQKYDFERSRDYLFEQGSKSFVFNVFAQQIMTAPQYYNLLSTLIVIMGGVMTLILWAVGIKKKV